jgi:uncharacterized protein (DUF433 family)
MAIGFAPDRGGRHPNKMGERIVTVDADVMGGTPVFAGTRVPVQTLLDYLEGGETIDDFLEGFPSVSRKHVIGFLEAASRQLIASAS